LKDALISITNLQLCNRPLEADQGHVAFRSIATQMALQLLAYNLTRAMNIVGIKPLLAAIRA
jgi:hypothetical protein